MNKYRKYLYIKHIIDHVRNKNPHKNKYSSHIGEGLRVSDRKWNFAYQKYRKSLRLSRYLQNKNGLLYYYDEKLGNKRVGGLVEVKRKKLFSFQERD